MPKTMEEVQPLQYASSATRNDANGGVTEETSERANEGRSELSTELGIELGIVTVKQFLYARYRVCIEPINAKAQEIIAARLKGSGGWHLPNKRKPYFIKIFSIPASDEAHAAIKPSRME
jgi:hypothetical protein